MSAILAKRERKAQIVDLHGKPLLGEGGKGRARRWESAERNRLNQHQWKLANGQPINNDLSMELETLRNRSEFEAQNNPYVAGVIETYITDLIGESGPELRVHSSDADYNKSLQDLFAAYWAMPDLLGQLSGVDLLRLCARSEWTKGESLIQFVVDANASGPIKTRLYAIHPRRLKNPVGAAGKNILLGIEVDDRGKPLHYFIEREELLFGVPSASFKFDTIEVKDLIHLFRFEEPGQLRGIPKMASCLQGQADLRDVDEYVMESVRNAAAQSTVLYTEDSSIEPFEIDESESVEIERGSHTMLPPKWKMQQIQPTQPAANYVDYRHERLRELGRPVCMPLMVVTLDSEGHNFSSMRFDNLGYVRLLKAENGRYERNLLNRIVNVVAREGELARVIRAAPPKVELDWIWPAVPSVDPEKEANAIKVLIALGLITYSEALAMDGKTLEQTIEKRVNDAKALEAAGLPPLPTAASLTPSGNPAPSAPDKGDAADQPPPAKPRKGAASADAGKRGKRT